MRRILYAVVASCLLCLPAAAGNDIVLLKTGGLLIPPAHQACHTDADCTVIEDICSRWDWHPINNESLPAAQALFNNAAIDCKYIPYTKPQAACVSGTCAFVPDRNNCLLYYESPPHQCAARCTEKSAQGACLMLLEPRSK